MCGVIVARYSLRQGIWKQTRYFLLLLASLWFVCSGSLELLVSGLETARRFGASLSVDTFDLWRERADTVLFLVSLVLLLSFLAYLIVRRLHAGP
ncbi:MAG: hypothetical protein ACLQUY_07490 [Ktedonobacterales bacterium]